MNIDLYSDIGGRSKNEDAVGKSVYEKNIVIVLGDGLGGQGDGEIASNLVCRELLQCGKEGFPNREQIYEAFQDANRKLLSMQKNKFHMKTTAVYLCISGKKAIWAHIGDSRLYHFYDGKIAHYTLDHSISQLAVYMGNITREEIPKDSGRGRLIRCMGIDSCEPAIAEEIIMNPGKHAFLVCSDGFWEYIKEAEMEGTLLKTDSSEQWLDILRTLQKQRCSEDCDNNTAAAVILEV